MLSIHSSPLGRLGTQDTGGMSIYVRELARDLGLRNHRVDIFTRGNDINGRKFRSIDLYPNVRLIYLQNQAADHLPKDELLFHLDLYTDAMGAFCAEQGIRYDILHSNYWLSGIMGQKFQRRWQRPHVITFHTIGALKDETRSAAPEPTVRIESEKDLAISCQRLLAPTERERDHLKQFCGAQPTKIGIVPGGVDFDLFRVIDRLEARRAVNLPLHDSLVLFVGRFDPMKGLDRLIEALEHLRIKLNLKVVVVGGDGQQSPAQQRIRKTAERLQVEDFIIWTGAVEHTRMPFLYNAADVVVIPSRYESFGLVALEAMACGTPVVATPVGVMDRIIRKGQNGFILDGFSASEIAQGINLALTTFKKRRVDVVRASIERYGWSSAASALVKEYDLALASHSNTRVASQN
jgi:D-inositol-3-phosphate glycosyltransferase